MEKSDKELIIESYDYLKNLCEFLSEDYESQFEEPATEEEIKNWENENNVEIPSMFKEWLLLTKNCDMSDRCCRIFWPEIEDEDNVLIGNFIGDGEYLYFSKKTGEFFTILDGEVEEYDSFDSVLVNISVGLEEEAEEIFGEDWMKEFEEKYN